MCGEVIFVLALLAALAIVFVLIYLFTGGSNPHYTRKSGARARAEISAINRSASNATSAMMREAARHNIHNKNR